MSKQPWRGVDSCGTLETLGHLGDGTERATAQLIGREAFRVATEDPKDGQRMEMWVSEELDCFPLQKALTGRHGELQERSVTRLTEGEPDVALFVVPPEYVEMSPVELEAAYAAKYAGASLHGKMLELMQSRYEASLLKKP